MIYVDNAATTWPKPEAVWKAVEDCGKNCGGNPGRGGHGMARAASLIIHEARENVAALLNVEDSNSIIFGLNATDAMNMALFGLVAKGDRIITTAMEHNAVARPLRYLADQGVKVEKVRAPKGFVNLTELREAIATKPAAIVVAHASNVTGAVLPLEEIGRWTREHNVMLIVDGAQTAGVEDIYPEEWGIDCLACSGHKGLLGPQGTGVLYVKPELRIRPFRFGGTGSLSESDQQPDFFPDKLESGTPNTPGLAGLTAGVRFILETGLEKIRQKEKMLADFLIDNLTRVKNIHIHGVKKEAHRTAVVSCTISQMDSSMLAHLLDEEYGIACRAGLHCAPWAHHSLGTMGTGTIRLSPGYFNTLKEMEAVVDAIKNMAERDI